MVEVLTEWGLYVFDGQVLEIFQPNGKSQRIHILFIKEAKLEQNRKGKLELWVDFEQKSLKTPPVGIPNENVSQAQALSDAINRAKNA